LKIETLTKGDGATVKSGDTVLVQYTGVLWNNGKVFDSSWTNGSPASFSTDKVVKGFGQALTGATVGSQVLVVIPPSAGYGSTAQGSIPANSTLVFAIDILGAQHTAS
jgi:peptidylprolyl isomerase